jgi:hypothetical protein
MGLGALATLALSGCHLLLALENRGGPADRSASREAVPEWVDAAHVDGRRFDALRPDGPRPDTAPPCFSESFTTAMSGWQATVGGGEWEWLQPTHAEQTSTSATYLHAFLALQDPGKHHLASAVVTTTFTVEGLLYNEFSHGAGPTLLVSPGQDSNHPHRQVACTVLQDPKTNLAYLYMLYYNGAMDVALPVTAYQPLTQPILNRTVTIQMRVEVTTDSWTVKCDLPSDGATLQDTAFVTSLVDATPLGFALGTYTAKARFDEVTICAL